MGSYETDGDDACPLHPASRATARGVGATFPTMRGMCALSPDIATSLTTTPVSTHVQPHEPLLVRWIVGANCPTTMGRRKRRRRTGAGKTNKRTNSERTRHSEGGTANDEDEWRVGMTMTVTAATGTTTTTAATGTMTTTMTTTTTTTTAAAAAPSLARSARRRGPLSFFLY
jgi:hypothetical protein